MTDRHFSLLSLAAAVDHKTGSWNPPEAHTDPRFEVYLHWPEDGLEDYLRKRGVVDEVLKSTLDDEIVQCSLCPKLLWFRDSWSPGDDLICAECDKEVSGRKHPPTFDIRLTPAPPIDG